MKKTLLFPAALLFCLPAFAAPQDSGADLLTGDKRLACEALLCLSSSTRPAECEPSIRRYFGIKHKRPGKTLSARKDFLRMCPSAGEKGMPELVNAIAEGAGRCDAQSLNRYNTRRGFDGGDVISSTLPEYCAAYAAHEYTAITLPRYVCSRRERDHDAWLAAVLGRKPYDASKDRCVSGYWQDVSADGK